MIRRLLERLAQWPFNPLSAAAPTSHPTHPRNQNSWPRYRKAMRKWGADWENTVPSRNLRLSPMQNFNRAEPLLCPEHFDMPALPPGSVCPFCGWPETPLAPRS